MRFNVHEAKTQLSRLLELVQAGEPVIIARHGTPIAELIPFRSKEFPFGAAKDNLLTPAGDEWWQPMPNDEAYEWEGGAMRVLADTHTLVWALAEPDRLNVGARNATAWAAVRGSCG